MRRSLSAVVAVTSFLCAFCAGHATEEILLKDEFDDKKVVFDARENEDVRKLAAEVDEFTGNIGRYKERDILALFGKPSPRPEKKYALPCCECRGLSLSFVRHGDLDKDHTEFYKIDDLAAFEFYYQVDGVSPAAVFLYFKVDEKFTPLTKPKDLSQRLAWDKERLQRVKKWFRAKRREVIQWEIDDAALKKQFQGDDSPELEERLNSWIETGKKLGHRFENSPRLPGERPFWIWFDEDGKFIRAALLDPAWKPGRKVIPHSFRWFDPMGRTVREESGREYISEFRWKGGKNFTDDIRIDRAEKIQGVWRPTSWSWLNHMGRVVREEWCDNGEGIPNQVSLDSEGEKEVRPLALKDSWAIHPDLIPEKYRIPDQERRKLPIRKIPED